jgi:ATP-dependent protease ClpP protease subunit
MITDNERKMLEDHGILILPDEITHDTFVLIAEAILIRPRQSISLYCHGSGGDSCATGAIVDLIHHHGLFTGLLAGEANSSHGVIFASCFKRYVYPGGIVGIHRVARESLNHVSAEYAMAHYQDLESHDRRNAQIYANACEAAPHDSVDFWFKMISENPRALRSLDASYLIECGMAKPIADRDLEALPLIPSMPLIDIPPIDINDRNDSIDHMQHKVTC